MHSRIRIRRPSPPMAVALLALFVALGGTSAYAVDEWTGENIADETLTGDDVRGVEASSEAKGTDGSLTGADISGQQAIRALSQPFVDGSLTTWDIRDNTVQARDVRDDSLTGTDIDETRLGMVPNADKVDGFEGTELLRSSQLPSRFVTRVGTRQVPAETQDYATAECPLGAVAVGGGAHFGTTSNVELDKPDRIISSTRWGARSWIGNAFNGGAQERTLVVTVICASG